MPFNMASLLSSSDPGVQQANVAEQQVQIRWLELRVTSRTIVPS
jgi:hypothetical protein